ncbi:DUF4153 domain-containing protein [Catellatospora tritici]|uniref:DUF4153 domain-containing protein n=1 Tax=Catellatospora tritici TaxID=2851566 RepID=UPI001C2DA19C|nr:DUF4153 domain-containing protein [Catellatospora tritici]MBV1853510.1 hypothetical protein [Catellatospora tritici]
MVLLILIGGLIGAVALPLTRLGVGWLLVATALSAIVLVARRRPRRSSVAIGVVAVLLVGGGALRAAPWLFLLCLGCALLLVSLAVGEQFSWRRLLRSPLALPAAALAGLAAGAASARGRGAPDPVGEVRPAGRAVFGWATALVAAIVVGALLAAADDVFAGVLGDLLPGPATLVRAAAGFVATAAVAAALIHTSRGRDASRVPRPEADAAGPAAPRPPQLLAREGYPSPI